ADTRGPKTSADSIKPQTTRIPARLRFCSLNNSLKTPQTAQGWGKQRRQQMLRCAHTPSKDAGEVIKSCRNPGELNVRQPSRSSLPWSARTVAANRAAA